MTHLTNWLRADNQLTAPITPPSTAWIASWTPAMGGATADVAASESTTSTTYTALTTAGPSVTFLVGPSGMVLLEWSAKLGNNTAGWNTYLSVSIDGGTTLDSDAINNSLQATIKITSSRQKLVTGLSEGKHTAELKYRVTGGTGTWLNRRLVAIPL